MRRGLLAGVAAAAALLTGVAPAGAVVCEPAEGHVEEAIRSGWPPDAPYDFVLIGTVDEVQALRGDSQTWGELIGLRIDAVLRGELSLAVTELYNPGVGTYGWETFEVGGQYLIAASASESESDTRGQIYTSKCAPNEEITTQTRFDELIAYSANPVLSNTALPIRSDDPSRLGWLLVAIAAAWAAFIRRSEGSILR